MRVKYIDQRLAASLQNGVIALLSNKASKWTSKWPGYEVVLVTGAALIAVNEWRKLKMNLRLSWLSARVAHGIILNTALSIVGQDGSWISTVNNLGVYLLLSKIEGEISGSTQYIFAENFAASVKRFGIASWAAVGLANQALKSTPRLRECTALIGVQLFQTWLRENVTGPLRFFTTILLLYFSENVWPGGLGGEIHSFAVYAASSDMEVKFLKTWIQFAGFWLLSTMAWDDITKNLLILASLHSGTSMIIEYLNSAAQTDPYLAILTTGVSVAIFLKTK